MQNIMGMLNPDHDEEEFFGNLNRKTRDNQDRPILERSFDMLQRAEGYFASAAYREATEPPYKRGMAHEELDKIRALLDELQKVCK